ncbi:Fic family protein [Cellulomonas citrea]|uniref:Fic family protein n=1 Tax=Cellulomonas citrea TaxID=1909423 RepID=UPI001358DC9E|nr:Fic family protein [Cellulomonas citrea]
MPDPEAALANTPYLVATDDKALKRLAKAQETALETRERAVSANDRIKQEAEAALAPYIKATRTDLVAESNIIEGYEWTPQAVREVVATHAELLDGSVRTLVQSVRQDPRVYEVLGLFRAHQIAGDWSHSDRVPRAHEIRELHRLVLGDLPGSGSYKVLPNRIGGTAHRTTPPEDVPRVMLELADWWAVSPADPLLTATVAHAWLVHIHPFEDGNGRLARILANLELARYSFPPLVVRAASDRGEYYAALAASDDGDILPLYELFGRVLRRQARIMARPTYVMDVINDQLLASEHDRFQMWRQTLGLLSGALASEFKKRGLTFEVQGTLDLGSFSLLCDRDVEGNGWFALVGAPGRRAEWLLWFGYRSNDWVDLRDTERTYPSIFLSRRDCSPDALHPFTRNFSTADLIAEPPDEISLVPAVPHPVHFRQRYSVAEHRPDKAAEVLAVALESGIG